MTVGNEDIVIVIQTRPKEHESVAAIYRFERDQLTNADSDVTPEYYTFGSITWVRIKSTPNTEEVKELLTFQTLHGDHQYIIASPSFDDSGVKTNEVANFVNDFTFTEEL